VYKTSLGLSYSQMILYINYTCSIGWVDLFFLSVLLLGVTVSIEYGKLAMKWDSMSFSYRDRLASPPAWNTQLVKLIGEFFSLQ